MSAYISIVLKFDINCNQNLHRFTRRKKPLSETRKCQSINFCMTQVLMLKWVVGFPLCKIPREKSYPELFRTFVVFTGPFMNFINFYYHIFYKSKLYLC